VNRTEKQTVIESIQSVIQENGTFYLVDYKGLKVKDISELRDKVRGSEGSLRVVKNTLLRRASEGTILSDASQWMEGPTALAWSKDDPVQLAKVLMDFAKTNPHLQVKGGIVEGQALDAPSVEALSKLPSMPELQAKIIGLLQAPAVKLVNVLQASARDMVGVLSQRAKQE
jgi:large subunit ribosomal protein L10